MGHDVRIKLATATVVGAFGVLTACSRDPAPGTSPASTTTGITPTPSATPATIVSASDANHTITQDPYRADELERVDAPCPAGWKVCNVDSKAFDAVAKSAAIVEHWSGKLDEQRRLLVMINTEKASYATAIWQGYVHSGCRYQRVDAAISVVDIPGPPGRALRFRVGIDELCEGKPKETALMTADQATCAIGPSGVPSCTWGAKGKYKSNVYP